MSASALSHVVEEFIHVRNAKTGKFELFVQVAARRRRSLSGASSKSYFSTTETVCGPSSIKRDSTKHGAGPSATPHEH